eukprot:11233330-Ditylum_brightwellii.AAC.1
MLRTTAAHEVARRKIVDSDVDRLKDINNELATDMSKTKNRIMLWQRACSNPMQLQLKGCHC